MYYKLHLVVSLLKLREEVEGVNRGVGSAE